MLTSTTSAPYGTAAVEFGSRSPSSTAAPPTVSEVRRHETTNSHTAVRAVARASGESLSESLTRRSTCASISRSDTSWASSSAAAMSALTPELVGSGTRFSRGHLPSWPALDHSLNASLLASSTDVISSIRAAMPTKRSLIAESRRRCCSILTRIASASIRAFSDFSAIFRAFRAITTDTMATAVDATAASNGSQIELTHRNRDGWFMMSAISAIAQVTRAPSGQVMVSGTEQSYKHERESDGLVQR